MGYNVDMGKVITARKAGEPDFIVMPDPRLVTIRSDKDFHFTGALAKNESEQENLTGLVSNKLIIHSVSIGSVQALHFRLEFYSKDNFTNPDLDEDTFIGSVDLDLSKYGKFM